MEKAIHHFKAKKISIAVKGHANRSDSQNITKISSPHKSFVTSMLTMNFWLRGRNLCNLNFISFLGSN